MLTKEKPELLDILADCYKHVAVMGKAFFPERFTLPWSKAHEEVCALLDDYSIQHLAIAAWRGFGKSSLVQIALPSQGILFKRFKFLVNISATSDLSIMQSENLKREIQTNHLIRKIWPDLKSSTFSKEMWVANNGDPGTLVFPRGAGQQIRGLLYNDSRPDMLIGDDLESPKEVVNPSLRDALLRWFYTDVMGSTERGSKSYRIIVIGTVLHEDSLLSRLLNDSGWTSVRYELCGDDFKSNWPEQVSDDEVLSMYRRFQEQGLANDFYREYRNIPVAAENVPITSDMFKYYSPEELLDPGVAFVVIVDPAKTAGVTACDTAIVCCGINNMKGVIYVCDIEAGHMHPDEMFQNAIKMCHRWNSYTLGIEVSGLDEFLTWPLRAAIQRSGRFIDVVELRPRKGSTMYFAGGIHSGKEARIASALVPLYRQGMIKHNKSHHMTPVLEGQLLRFLSSGKKDIADALSYVAGMMDRGERYFAPEFVSKEDASPEELRTAFLDPAKEARALAELRLKDKAGSHRGLTYATCSRP